MKSIRTLKFLLPLLFLTFLFSCNNSDSDNASKSQPTISIRLVDAPGDYEAVNVEIMKIYIKMDDPYVEDDNLEDDDYSDWIPVKVTPETVNLLDFTGGISKVLVERFPIPAGTLSQMRLVLGDGNSIIMHNDSDEPIEQELKTPSALQSGLKLKVDALIEEGFTYDFVLDFDVDKSIVHAGNSGNINLKPVLYVSAEVNSGIIEGTVTPNDVPAKVSVLVDDKGDADPLNDFVISAFTDESGAFALWGVPPGTYEVMVNPTSADSDYMATSVMDVVVTVGNVTVIANPIELILKPGTITGTITGLEAGEFATVSIDDAGNTSVDTNTDGTYMIDNVTPGDYTVTISSTGYITQNITVTINPDEDKIVDALLVK